MEADIKRYQIIKSLDELPTKKIHARPFHIRTYWRKDNDFFIEKIVPTVGKALKESEIEAAKSMHTSIEEHFGLTQEEVFNTLLELYNGQQGYYVVDLKNRQYFHCKNYEDMEVKLEALGCKSIEY
jgi:hypothetical protein